MKNVGNEKPTRARPTMVRSCHLPRRRAAKMPDRIPTTIQITNAPAASWIVTGRRSTISSVTHVDFWKENPRAGAGHVNSTGVPSA